MSSGGAIGVDLGSHTTLLATVKAGGVEVLTNDLGNRSTPTIISLGDKERYLGEAGLSKINANFRNTVLLAPRLLGLSPGYEHLADEMKWQTCRCVPVDGKLRFELQYKGETHRFTAEQIVAMHLTMLKQLCTRAGAGMSDVVISVPAYFTEVERRALLDAAAIADVKCVRLMNDTTASALSYGLFRQKELTEEPRNVAIVDMGHSKLSVAIVAFTKEKLQILSKTYDRHLGGRDFDWMLMEHFAAEFKAKRRLDPLQNGKSRLKLATACEKLRKVLSGNSDAHINVDCLVEDYDFASTFTREALESLCAPLLDRIQIVCSRALQDSGLEKVHSVEIVGGGTRMPYVQTRIAQAFHLEGVSRTMNAEETVARGCSVQAAMLSAFFKVKDYGVADRTPYPINISVKYVEEQDEAMAAENLFAANNVFPVSKVLTLHKSRPFVMELFYPGDLPAGFERTVARYTVKCPVAAEDQKLKVTIKMNGHGVVNLEAVEKVETQIVEEMAAEPASKPEEEKTASTPPTESPKPDPIPKEPKKKSIKTAVFSDKWSSSLPDSELHTLKSLEQSMKTSDRQVRDTAEKKNELESMIYSWRDKLTSSYREYVLPATNQEITATLSGVEEWLYGDGSDSTKAVYVERIGKLREMVDSIERRYRGYREVPEAAEELRKTVAECEELAQSQIEKYTHIPVADREQIVEQCRATRVWLDSQILIFAAATRSQNSPLDPEEIVKKGIQLRELTNSIMNKPKPAPPKEVKDEATKKPDEAKMDTEEDASEVKMDAGEGKLEAEVESGEAFGEKQAEPMQLDS